MPPFSLLIKPASADCNLRCDYCFYLEKSGIYPSKPKHRMSDDVLERMISSFLQTEQPNYSFGWQGGEPTLMGVDFFRRVTELQQKYGRAGAQISNGLQTNATLIDDEFAEHLGRYRFLVGVSLDGPSAIHDHYRVHADGRGSHAEVMKGISNLRKHGVEFNVLVLVSKSNVKRPREIYNYLKEQGVYYHQYIECVEFDDQGNLMPYAIEPQEWGEFLCAIYDEWRKEDTYRVSIRRFDSIVGKMVDGGVRACNMGEDCRQYFVVEHNGDIYPCDFFVEPRLLLGNVMKDRWETLQRHPLYQEFGRRKRRYAPECGECKFLEFCHGDCPKNRMRGPSSTPEQLSHLCAGWKMFYSHALPGLKELAEEVKRQQQPPAVGSGGSSGGEARGKR
ncbi:MAG: anaerobic sulfatase maturase, partial [Verrucomicrobiota bacterium]